MLSKLRIAQRHKLPDTLAQMIGLLAEQRNKLNPVNPKRQLINLAIVLAWLTIRLLSRLEVGQN